MTIVGDQRARGRESVTSYLEQLGVVAVIRVRDPERVRGVVDALAASVTVPAIPGCLSPTEILAAHEMGADIIKVFPATALGPQYIKDVHGPMPQVRLMPTGGVTVDNAADWIRAGAVAVGLGSALIDGAALDSGRFDVVTANARRVVAAVASARR